MKIRLRYFSFIQDFTNKSSEEIETECKTVECLLEQLSSLYGEDFLKVIKNGLGSVRISILVNGKANVNNINDGDEIAFLPPPSGGELYISKRFDLLEEIKKFREKAPPEAGSLVVYLGFVKGIVENHKVYELKYEAYEEYTRRRFKEIIDGIKKKYNDLIDIQIIHVIDNMKPGEDVILIMALGKGRKDAIHAVEETLELVKHTTGIWKLEIRDDGEFWVVAGNTRVRRNEKGSST
ncbi:MoaD family protein [Sulfolobus sp. S-194]|uniref:MoaD family protein n=1 Tax=Sulfolobus sp. S-194 TaxID=2512240 RepID=UPI001436FD83|nr:MoaD family protein [Sulfolobus sp. S-194]QIW23390.1 MoaD family protein [Sulfolobus sp. S-194]